MKTILVPTDFSKTAGHAVNVAIDIAKKTDGKIILLHVIELPEDNVFNSGGEVSASDHWEEKIFTTRLVESGRAQLTKISEEIKQKGVKVSQELKLGNAYHGISTIISEQKVDLVVMGTFGHSRLESMIVGSITEKVIRNATCPVLTVHGKPGTNDYKNIVYATSMSDDEKKFANVVTSIQKMCDAIIHVVRINTPNNFQPDVLVKKVMNEFIKKTQLENYTLNIFNDYSEEEGIIRFAESIDADLIAMATHGRKGLAHVLVGSVAEDVVNHTKRPVLTHVNR
jgi:nucleotide-binding universal stress UspA family protein